MRLVRKRYILSSVNVKVLPTLIRVRVSNIL